MRTKTIETLYIASPRLNQLNIAKELAADPHLTQAELARRCGLSVSMVNNYLKELCSLGWLEYHRRSSKSVSYHMTPSGLAHLDEIQRELIHEMVDLFALAKECVVAAIIREAGCKPRRVAVCGRGHLAQLVCDALSSSGIGVTAGFNDSPENVDSPDAIVVAPEFPWAMDDLPHILQHAQGRGIPVVRLNGDLAHPAPLDCLQRDSCQPTAAR